MVNFRDSYFSVQWDLSRKHLYGTFWGKQYDTGRGFTVTVINGGQVVTPSTEVLRLKWEKPDNTAGYVNATVVNGKFIVENIDQMFTVHGSVRADFELSVAGEFVASITFYVNVEKAVAVDAAASSSQFTALQYAVGSVDSFNTALLSKRDKSIPISQNDISDELRQQIAGTAPINAVPAKGSVGRDRLVTRVVGEGQTDFLSTGKNLFDKDNLTAGYAINSSGALFSSSTYSVTDYLNIEANKNYVTNIKCFLALYDANFNFISRPLNDVLGTFLTPADAVYMRVSVFTGSRLSLQIEEGISATEYEPYLNKYTKLKLGEQNFKINTMPVETIKGLKVGKNLFNKNKVTSGYVNMADGLVHSKDNYSVSDFIQVAANTVYSKSHYAEVVFYDANKIRLSSIADIDSTKNLDTFTTPENTLFVRMSTPNINLDVFQFEQNEQQTFYEPFGYRVDGLLYDTYIQSLSDKIKEAKTKHPVSNVVNATTYLPGNFNHVLGDIDKDGSIWAIGWQNLIRKSKDGIKFKTIIDANPFLNVGETISLYGFLVADNGRIICATNNGRVLISDEEQTTLTEAFQFEEGFTQNTWGYEKKGRYILFGTYMLSKSAENQGREVYFSQDFGETWTRIFNKSTADMIDYTNYHIHDVAFDQYSDCILISIGDGANRNILYSYNYGETWLSMFDETVYNAGNWAPIHPTSIVVFPDGIAMGSDELPEGICWWNRPEGVHQPEIKWEDCEYKVKYNEDKTLIGTLAVKGDALETDSGIYGIMPFQNHVTQTEGHTRLFATADAGQTWHEVFKANEWSPDLKGFFNARLRKEGDGVYVYASYSISGSINIWRAKLPNFIYS